MHLVSIIKHTVRIFVNMKKKKTSEQFLLVKKMLKHKKKETTPVFYGFKVVKRV